MLFSRETFFELVRFGVVGVVATALHYCVYWLLYGVMDVNVAYTLGYLVSFGFACAHLFNYLLQISLLNFFIWLGVSKVLAPVPVYCVAIPTNFLIVRFVVFHNRSTYSFAKALSSRQNAPTALAPAMPSE